MWEKGFTQPDRICKSFLIFLHISHKKGGEKEWTLQKKGHSKKQKTKSCMTKWTTIATCQKIFIMQRTTSSNKPTAFIKR